MRLRASRSLLVASIVVTVLCTGCQPKYGDMMMKAFQAALGKDFHQYQFRSYPVDNYGVWTMYDGAYDPTNYLCDTWSCLNIKTTEIPTDASGRLNVSGHAAVGRGGNLTLTTDQQQDLGVNVVVPQIMHMLDVNASADWKKHVKIGLSANGGYQRFVNAPDLAALLNKLDNTDIRKQAYKNGTLTVVISDLVINSLTVTIDLDSTGAGGLDAKLTQALQGKTGTIIGKDADVSFKVNTATTGHYEFQTVSAVIVAMLPKTEPKPPSTYAFTKEITIPNFDDWKTTKIDDRTVRGVTQKPLQ